MEGVKSGKMQSKLIWIGAKWENVNSNAQINWKNLQANAENAKEVVSFSLFFQSLAFCNTNKALNKKLSN